MSSPVPANFYICLARFLLQTKQQIIAAAAEYGLTSMQALTLLILDDTPQPMNSFRKLYDCDASNITGIIDGLEDKRLVSRQPHAEDRRIKIIQLEAAGRQIRSQIISHLSGQVTDLFHGLSEAEIAQLASLITKVAKSA